MSLKLNLISCSGWVINRKRLLLIVTVISVSVAAYLNKYYHPVPHHRAGVKSNNPIHSILQNSCWVICKLILHTHRVHHCCLQVIPDNVLDSNIFLENCSRPTSRVETSTAKRQKMTFLTQVNMLPFYKTPTILIYQQQWRGEFTESWVLQTILSSSCS